ncbi:hypothetical protein DFH11DRAFT_1544411 [Phellopilus nigrolimitatus]|nr:hypothetical protein DFH11DRAFT_1544411 [Phellopilus nigrolimitatus]
MKFDASTIEFKLSQDDENKLKRRHEQAYSLSAHEGYMFAIREVDIATDIEKVARDNLRDIRTYLPNGSEERSKAEETVKYCTAITKYWARCELSHVVLHHLRTLRDAEVASQSTVLPYLHETQVGHLTHSLWSLTDLSGLTVLFSRRFRAPAKRHTLCISFSHVRHVAYAHKMASSSRAESMRLFVDWRGNGGQTFELGHNDPDVWCGAREEKAEAAQMQTYRRGAMPIVVRKYIQQSAYEAKLDDLQHFLKE